MLHSGRRFGQSSLLTTGACLFGPSRGSLTSRQPVLRRSPCQDVLKGVVVRQAAEQQCCLSRVTDDGVMKHHFARHLHNIACLRQCRAAALRYRSPDFPHRWPGGCRAFQVLYRRPRRSRPRAYDFHLSTDYDHDADHDPDAGPDGGADPDRAPTTTSDIDPTFDPAHGHRHRHRCDFLTGNAAFITFGGRFLHRFANIKQRCTRLMANGRSLGNGSPRTDPFSTNCI